MRRRGPYVLVGLAVCLLLAACGQTTSSNLAPAPGSSGSVQVTVGASAYQRSDAISVTIANQGGSDIFAADHQSQCTIVQLQMQSGNAWQQMGKCAVMTPTRMHQIGHGASQVVTLAAPQGGWAAGTYRVSLAYSSTEKPGGMMSEAHSAEFQVKG
jgi:hypothetical protein